MISAALVAVAAYFLGPDHSLGPESISAVTEVILLILGALGLYASPSPAQARTRDTARSSTALLCMGAVCALLAGCGAYVASVDTAYCGRAQIVTDGTSVTGDAEGSGSIDVEIHDAEGNSPASIVTTLQQDGRKVRAASCLYLGWVRVVCLGDSRAARSIGAGR